MWVNPGEIPGNGIDDDNNGFIDDVQGWNFVSDNNDPDDDNGHGTQVAGVARQPRIMPRVSPAPAGVAA